MYLTRSVTHLFTPADKEAVFKASFDLDTLVWDRMTHEEEGLRNKDPIFAGIPFQTMEDLQNYQDSSGSNNSGNLEDLDHPCLEEQLQSYEDLNDFQKRSRPEDIEPTADIDNRPLKKKRKRPTRRKIQSQDCALKASAVRVSAQSTPEQPQPPDVRYRVNTSRSSRSFQKAGLTMQERKHARSVARRRIPKEQLIATTGFVDIEKDSRITGGFWMGINVKKDFRGVLSRMLDNGVKLRGLTLVFFERTEIIICDSQGRIVIYRSSITRRMKDLILPKVNTEALRFIEATAAPTPDQIAENDRGDHWHHISGLDRNNKAEPDLSAWHKAHRRIHDEDFFAENSIFHVLTLLGCDLVKQHFPRIYQRFKDCSDYMRDRYGEEFKAPYGGIFFNFCVNGVRYGVPRVFCKPHVDHKNVALGVCMVFVYGHFDHREKCWLVIWEAGVALELPPGVFVIYPSSLFLHFNVDLSQLEVVVTQGEAPTKENSRPVHCSCGSINESTHGQAWKNADGRGSMVWFNQASLFQTAELGYNTVKAARAAGDPGVCTKTSDELFSKAL
ncbi:hypothetical protein VNI00_011163 [Paramarasmius palmivorus]|uniref:Uncharacterized protein n=1 Tax=Paramarasmius palmivorus TaxID=297713 RepID=A0AAW0CEC7_9AGAR